MNVNLSNRQHLYNNVVIIILLIVNISSKCIKTFMFSISIRHIIIILRPLYLKMSFHYSAFLYRTINLIFIYYGAIQIN